MMWKSARSGIAILLATLSSSAAALAASGDLKMKYNDPGPHSPMLNQHLYEVRVSCSPGASLPDGRTGIAWIDNANATGSHYIAIANDPPTLDAATGKITLPSTVKALIPLYSFKGNSKLPLLSSCKQSFVLSGGPNFYLIPVESFSTSHTPGILLQLAWNVAKAIPSVFSVFTTHPIPTAVTDKLTDIGNTKDSLTTLLATLNTDDNYGTSLTLQKGRYRISTTYSVTTLDVADLPSMAKADAPSIRSAFQGQLDKATDALTATNIATTCRTIAAQLAVTGMSQDIDVPYALAYRAIKSGLGKTDIMDCLGPDYAMRAAQLGALIWQYAAPSEKVSEEDVLDYIPLQKVVAIQPSYSTIRRNLFSLVTQMSIISKSGIDNAKDNIATLNSLMNQQVFLDDQSGLFPGQTQSMTPMDLLNVLFKANYLRFGCFTENTDSTGKYVDNAVAIFLGFKAKLTDTGTTLDNVIAIHVLYLHGLVSKIVVLSNQDFITAVLGSDPAKWSCNGFTVAKSKPVANAQ
jgi:hypothetical protein